MAAPTRCSTPAGYASAPPRSTARSSSSTKWWRAPVIAQQWEGDVRIVLFVILREGITLDGALESKIRSRIRANATPRHVPARIVQVTDIPRTRSGKITELAVRDVVHGRAVKNREALANPQALEQFAGRPELKV